jgi:cbb3-type cytochrome oxidase maturation protein
MSTLYLILGLAVGGAGAAVIAFAWSVGSGQLDDLDTPPLRVLIDKD